MGAEGIFRYEHTSQCLASDISGETGLKILNNVWFIFSFDFEIILVTEKNNLFNKWSWANWISNKKSNFYFYLKLKKIF